MGGKGRVAFIHPDLGLGGAERLIVDAAVGLQQRGFEVTVYTGYHDPSHAFPETVDSTLKVVTVGQALPRSIYGRFVALCAFIKMSLIALYVAMLGWDERRRPDVVVVDQVSACIPFLRLIPKFLLGRPEVLFYCHFPDQLLTERRSFLKRVYRKPLDWVEERSTGAADKVVVNSEFTRRVFKDTFTSLRLVPDVLYPSINYKLFDELMKSKQQVKLDVPPAKHLFLSINRFEPKKNIALAVRGLKKLRTCLEPEEWSKVYLVLAGGYDPRLQSSVIYLEQMKKLVVDEGLEDKVKFILSPKDLAKVRLLSMCSALVYTPSNEHFGIVPLEAMYMAKPVIAVNTGGPRETVEDGTTGFLCPATEVHFATAMARIVKEPRLAEKMGKAGKQRFMENFSFDAFTDNWVQCVTELVQVSSNYLDRDHND